MRPFTCPRWPRSAFAPRSRTRDPRTLCPVALALVLLPSLSGAETGCAPPAAVELARTRNDDAGDGGARQSQLADGGLPVVADSEETRMEYCAGAGPPVRLIQPNCAAGGTADPTSLLSRAFQYALCSCGDVALGGAFMLDAFDSAQGAHQGGQSGANFGVNGQLLSGGGVNIRGSLTAAGGGLLSLLIGTNNIEGDLRTNAALSLGAATFGSNLWVDGEISLLGAASVTGDVYQTPGHTTPIGLAVGGRVLAQDFSIAPPCTCGASDLLNIDEIVAGGTARSDNEEVGLSANAFSLGVPLGGGFELPCGRFALSSTSFGIDNQITASGRTALFIDGDLEIGGSFAAQLGPHGEIDVFMTGSLTILPGAQVGSPDRPSALRFYLAAQGSVFITAAVFAAELYAPGSVLAVTAVNELYGAAFVGSYAGAGDSRMHYDVAVQRLGSSTSKPCTDPTRATGCASDPPCTSPLVCDAGTCALDKTP